MSGRRTLVLLPLLVLTAGAAPASARQIVTAIGTGTAVVRRADRHDHASTGAPSRRP